MAIVRKNQISEFLISKEKDDFDVSFRNYSKTVDTALLKHIDTYSFRPLLYRPRQELSGNNLVLLASKTLRPNLLRLFLIPTDNSFDFNT